MCCILIAHFADTLNSEIFYKCLYKKLLEIPLMIQALGSVALISVENFYHHLKNEEKKKEKENK